MAIVTPTRWDPHGDAVAEGAPDARGRVRPVHVAGGIVGEPATVTVLHEGQNRIATRILAPVVASPSRRDVPCGHALQTGGACGGCPWLHLSPDGARDARRALVQDAMDRHGVDVTVAPVVAGPDDAGGWRHVVKLVAYVSGGRTHLGAYAPRSHDGLAVTDCLALAPALRPFTRLGALDLPDGSVRALVARTSRRTGRVLATLIVTQDTSALRAFADTLPADGVFLHVNTREGDALTDASGELMYLRGDDVLEESAGDGVVTLGPLDFYQTNPGVAEHLWRHLRAQVASDGTSPALIDLYAGVGAVTVALLHGQDGARALAVESFAPAAARARANLDVAGVAGEARAIRVSDLPLEAMTALGDHAALVANPPRKGFEDGVLARTVAWARARSPVARPATLAIVSCHPEPLARDLGGLRDAGFKVRSLTPFDMFPGTPHVECVAVLEGPALDRIDPSP